MRRYLLTFLSLVLFLGQSLCLSAQTQTKESKLLMTIGCISDTHCEYGLLTAGDANTVKLRRTFPKTMQLMKEQENVDVILCGGDVTGLSSANQSNWERSRELFVNEIQNVFNEGYDPHLLVASGNHEYQAGGTKYNSADYYSNPIIGWNGDITAGYYESASNASFPLLAAYHYNIKGIDFVVLNTAKYLFANSNDYSYSKESAEWCIATVDSLYEKNPNGTVFFVMHIPFGDSNSISSSSKGISSKDGSSDILKKGLAKHPNTIVLYGHDHGGDLAYTREKTSQRLTRYNTSGQKMSSVTDVNHVDGTEQPVATEPTTTPVETVTRTVTCLQNVANSKYLGRDASDLNLLNEPFEWTLTSQEYNSTSMFQAVCTYEGKQYNLSCGGSGRFSTKDRVGTVNEQECGYWYRVDDINASTVTGTRVSTIEKGKNYIIVQYYKENNNSTNTYFALGNALASTSYQRVASYGLGKTVDNTITIDNANNAAQAYIYTYKDETITEQVGGETTSGSSVTPEPSDASFITLFMGSMRYYNNKMDGGYDSGYDGNDTVASRVIQALIVYVYEDRIELRMKNYGETGTFTGTGSSTTSYGGTTTPGSVTVYEDLTPYTIFRKVVRTTDDEDGGDPVEPVEPGPISDVFYKVTSDGEWLPAEIVNRSFTLNDATWKGINTEDESQFDAINYVRLYKSSAWQGFNVPFEFTVTADHLKAFNFAKIQGAIAEENGTTSIAYVPLQAGDVVKANTPYVIKARKANSKTPQTLVAQNATMKVPVESGFTVQSATDIYEFNGIYNDKVAEKDAKWYALNSNGTYQHMSKGVVLQPFRIFMDVTPRDDNPYAAKSTPATNQNAKVYYKTSANGSWIEASTADNTLTIDDYNWKGFKIEGNRTFSTINYSRIFKVTEWQAWYVPFDLKLDNQILKNFSFAKIQGALAEEDGADNIAYVRLKAGDVLNANTPYVIKAKKANSSTPQVITVKNATLRQTPTEANGFTVSSASDEYGFYGVFNARVSTSADWDQWYAINNSGNYQHMAAGVTLQPFRLYMTINPRENNPYELSAPQEEVKIRVLGDDFDEADPTAINEINVDAQQQTGKWYNLQGMEVNAPSKGIYIKDGKKYLF